MVLRSWVLVSVLAAPAWAGMFDLANYQLSAHYPLPAVEASEASAVTYNWDSGTLFVLGDEGDAVAEIAPDGTFLGSMSLTGFDDTEGLTYMGNGQFVLVEERLQDAYQFIYSGGGNVDRSSMATASLGGTVGNVGLEGISFDPLTGQFIAVKEKTPQQVINAAIDFAAGTATVSDLFTPDLGLLDLSDVQVLSGVSGIDPADLENLLIYSQESSLLLEVSRSGLVLSQFDFSTLADDAEGVTIDSNGVIYVVGEAPEMFALTPIPEPASLFLLGGLVLLAVSRRSRV